MGTSIDHTHLLTNSKSSISKPSAKSLDPKRRKLADAATLSLQPTNLLEVSMFKAIAHVSFMRWKGLLCWEMFF